MTYGDDCDWCGLSIEGLQRLSLLEAPHNPCPRCPPPIKRMAEQLRMPITETVPSVVAAPAHAIPAPQGDRSLHLFGTDLFGEAVKPKPSGVLADRFATPPFSVLDAKSGEWQARKRAWLALGLRSEEGRGRILQGESKSSAYQGNGYAGMRGGVEGTTSIFDPVVCELAYRWFCPPGGQVVDPFAGGSVRGIVAASLGRRYWGSDLSHAQVSANREQAALFALNPEPEWVVGDSLETMSEAPTADFVFTCPPYGDLEQYSDDPRDLSNMEHHTFIAAYKRIILRSVKAMRPDSFACAVVGDFRDKHGHYRDFVSATINAFTDAGAALYNEAILATPLGSAAVRAPRFFVGSRKLVKVHQNVLVFVKGDWKRACSLVGAEV